MSILPDLSTLFIGKGYEHFESLDSTNNRLKQINREGVIAEGYTVTTDYQTSGRGQIGNAWQSESGRNLLTSVFLRPTVIKASEYFFLNMSVCLAIAETLSFFHPGFKVKWPNDILFDTKKIAGVLIENSISRNQLNHSIIGIGINVNQRDFQSVPNATSLSRIVGNEIDLGFLLSKLLKNLELRYLQLLKSTKNLNGEYLQSLYGYAKEVSVEIKGVRKKAEVLNVLPDGTLLMLIDGHQRQFQFKEIQFLL